MPADSLLLVNAAQLAFRNKPALATNGAQDTALGDLLAKTLEEQLLKRFRKKVAKSGILSTVRRKRWFVSKSELRRIDKKKAVRRHKRRQITDAE